MSVRSKLLKRTSREGAARIAVGLASVGCVVLAWWYMADREWFNPTLLPGPNRVISAFDRLIDRGTLQEYTLVSLDRVVKGFIIAFAVAVPLGTLMSLSKWIYWAVDPLIELVRPVPPLAIIPLAILWFGIGESSKLFIIAYGAFFPIIVNVLAGFRTVDGRLVRAADSLGASRLQSFWHVTMHSAFEHIVVGMRLGLSMAFLVLVGAELIAASSGLGFLIQDARNRFRSDEILVGIISIGILGYILNTLLLRLERVLLPWKSHSRGKR